MGPNEPQVQKHKKGLKGPGKVWKLTLPLWLAVTIGGCVPSLEFCAIDGRLRGVGALPIYMRTPSPVSIPLPTNAAVSLETPDIVRIIAVTRLR